MSWHPSSEYDFLIVGAGLYGAVFAHELTKREFSVEWKLGMEPYYPVNDAENNVIFGGRLGQYKYYDMDKVIRTELDDLKSI